MKLCVESRRRSHQRRQLDRFRQVGAEASLQRALAVFSARECGQRDRRHGAAALGAERAHPLQ